MGGRGEGEGHAINDPHNFMFVLSGKTNKFFKIRIFSMF